MRSAEVSMAKLLDNPKRAFAAPEGDRTALFRRAAQAAATAHLLIHRTEELLAQTRQVLKRTEARLVAR
jgi:hypothetical protein